MIYSEQCNFWHMQMLVFIDVFICHLTVSEVVQQLAVQNSLHGQFLKTVKIVQSRMSRTWMHVVFPHESTWHPFSLISFLVFYLVISLALSHTHPLPSALQHIYSVVLCCVSADRVGVLYTLMTVFVLGARSQEQGWMDGWLQL